MSYKPGEQFVFSFTTKKADTGTLTNADALPTGTLRLNGVNVADTVTITNMNTGEYRAIGTINASWAAGDDVEVLITAIVAGKTGKAFKHLGQLVSKQPGELATPADVLTQVGDGLEAKGYTTGRASRLDFLDASISSVLTAISGVATAVWSFATRTLTDLGSIGSIRAGLLDLFQAILRKDVSSPVDLGGTYDPALHSQEAIRERGDLAWGGTPSVNVTIGPFHSAEEALNNVGEAIELSMFAKSKVTFVLAVIDANGDPVNLTGKTLRFTVYDQDTAPATAVFKVESGDITVSGTGSDTANVTVSSTKSDVPPKTYNWVLWDVASGVNEALLNGTLGILPAQRDAA